MLIKRDIEKHKIPYYCKACKKWHYYDRDRTNWKSHTYLSDLNKLPPKAISEIYDMAERIDVEAISKVSVENKIEAPKRIKAFETGLNRLEFYSALLVKYSPGSHNEIQVKPVAAGLGLNEALKNAKEEIARLKRFKITPGKIFPAAIIVIRGKPIWVYKNY